jgi:enediyne biosynthesis protein E4
MKFAAPQSFFSVLLLAVSLCACAEDEATGPTQDIGVVDAPLGTDGDTQTDGPLLEVSDQETDGASTCAPATPWEPGTPIFVEVTDDWGLTGVTGHTFSVVDYDGDGWQDLFIRHGQGDLDFKDYAPGVWLLRNTGEGGFEDQTEASGILTPRVANEEAPWRSVHVAVFGDVNNDGNVDLFGAFGTPAEMGIETPDLFLGQGDGTFALGPAESMLRREGLVNSPDGAAWTDYDRDGWLDLWVAHHDVSVNGSPQPLADHLYHGDGAGMFLDFSSKTGVVTFPWGDLSKLNAGQGHSWAWSAAACDLNHDGTPELLAASYGRAPNVLWQGARDEDGAVTFLNRGVASGYAYDHREDWTDNWSAQCYCTDNPSAEDCDLVTEPIDPQICAGLKGSFGENMRWNHGGDREPWRLAGNSGSTICADLDSDGDLDLFTNEIVHGDVGSSSDPSEILVNTGEANVRFERPGPEVTGVHREHPPYVYWDHGDMTSEVLDLDNDGLLDIYLSASDYVGNRGVLYHQKSPLSFEEVSIEDAFEHNRSYGAVAADFDRDGDLDLLVGHSHMRCEPNGPNDCYPTRQTRLFENVIGQDGHWIQLELVGAEGTNRSAIGAQVTVKTSERVQMREVSGGWGKGGFQSGLVVHVGLGDACEAQVSVRWPNAELTTEEHTLAAGARYRLIEGQSPEISAP